MGRFLTIFAVLFALLVPVAAHAEPSDIDAAARGVVRVVVIGSDGGEVYPVSHGSGFAVTPTTIVTNAHVVLDALRDEDLQLAIVPSEGEEAAYGRVVSVSQRNDLALVEIVGELRLPPLTLAGGEVPDSGEAWSVGYPMNVDRAQGLEIGDIFLSQPPVESRGFLAGERPSRQFHTVLHTAPIARGNSGGPLLDGCGRVLGVNSFGADSGGADAEFFFAVSNRELVPFLRENGIEPRINDSVCRSLAELDEAERERIQREQMLARQELERSSEEQRARRDRARFEAEMQVRDERDDRMFASVLLLILAAGLGWWAYEKRAPFEAGGETVAWPTPNKIAAAGAVGLLMVAVLLQVTRPGIDEIDRRVSGALAEGGEGEDGSAALAGAEGARRYRCTLEPQRSRITSAQVQDIAFEWTANGCVNGRTQYGFASGVWSRALVPNDEQAVSVNSFDPARRVFRTERYLLSRSAMQAAREARGNYDPPQCNGPEAAAILGERQGAVLAALPAQPNERLVYSCEVMPQ